MKELIIILPLYTEHKRKNCTHVREITPAHPSVSPCLVPLKLLADFNEVCDIWRWNALLVYFGAPNI